MTRRPFELLFLLSTLLVVLSGHVSPVVGLRGLPAEFHEENRALFEALWKTLAGDIDPGSAVHQVFDEVDLELLGRDFWRFVKEKQEAR